MTKAEWESGGFSFRTQHGWGKQNAVGSDLGLGLAEIMSTFPCSRNGLVIRTGLETMVAIWSQAPREQSKHRSLAAGPRGSFLEVSLPPAPVRPEGQAPAPCRLAFPFSPGFTPGGGSCALLPGGGSWEGRPRIPRILAWRGRRALARGDTVPPG